MKFNTLLLAVFVSVPILAAASNTHHTNDTTVSHTSTLSADNQSSSQSTATVSFPQTLNITNPQSTSVVITQPQEQKIKNTPGMFIGGLTSSHDTCLGSASGGVSTPGFGFTVGGTNIDKNCVMRKNADMLYRMGMQAAAVALICAEDATIKKALEATGFKCAE